MKKTFLFIFTLFIANCLFAQNTFKAIVRNDRTKAPLKGATATITGLTLNAVSDSAGLIILKNIPNGKFEIKISYVSFIGQEKALTFPLAHPNQIFEFGLEPQTDELDEVTIQTTRTNQNLRDIPTRIEALPAEELDEKSTMSPGNIKMLLGESTGINVQ
jgi:outer membrane receptor for ferrienterochelin and colicins